MMHHMSLEDLEMEVEEVEARATDLMETEDVDDEPSIEMEYDAPSNNSQGSSSLQGEVGSQYLHCTDCSNYDAPCTSQGSCSHQGERFTDKH